MKKLKFGDLTQLISTGERFGSRCSNYKSSDSKPWIKSVLERTSAVGTISELWFLLLLNKDNIYLAKLFWGLTNEFNKSTVDLNKIMPFPFFTLPSIINRLYLGIFTLQNDLSLCLSFLWSATFWPLLFSHHPLHMVTSTSFAHTLFIIYMALTKPSSTHPSSFISNCTSAQKSFSIDQVFESRSIVHKKITAHVAHHGIPGNLLILFIILICQSLTWAEMNPGAEKKSTYKFV